MQPAADIASILVVDDDARLRGLLSEYLSDQGFFVYASPDAAHAREALQWIAFDAIVLDRMMPGESGLDFAQSHRESVIPIIMLTAMAESEDRIEGLEAGVQDYVTKPFEPRELVLRLHNVLRQQRQTKQQQSECRFGAYRYQLATSRLFKDDAEIYLTASEQAILHCLAKAQGSAVSRDAINAALGIADGSAARSIDVQVNRLRKKIEADPSRPIHVQTIRGEGYILK